MSASNSNKFQDIDNHLKELINEYFLSEYTPIVCSISDWYEHYEQEHYKYLDKLLKEINEYIYFEGSVNDLLMYYNYNNFDEAMIDINDINWKNKFYHNYEINKLKKIKQLDNVY